MKFAGVTAEMIRPGLWRLDVRCRIHRYGGARCDGELRVDRCGSDPQFLWETFCKKCSTCDCNGHPSLRDCMATAAEYFSGPQ